MIVNKAYKFRLEPNKTQTERLNKSVGSIRFVYNYFLKLNKEKYEKEKQFIFNNEMIKKLPSLKEEYPFLKEVFSQSLQTAVRNLSNAFTRCFKGLAQFPQFKKKGKHDSFTCPQKFRILQEKNKIFIPKVGEVKYRNSQEITGEVKSITISKKNYKWFVSVLTEQEITLPEKTFNNPVGIDVGLKSFAVLSNGDEIENPRFYRKLENKLKKESRKLSSKIKFSKNWIKQKIKLAKLQEYIANCRRDFLDKVSTKIVNNHDVICIEDLNVKGMIKNRHLSKSISDVGWGMFTNMLKYKSFFKNKSLIEVERFYPSSKTCSKCGSLKLMPLHLRTYVCENCNSEIDRDYNASLNILNRGLILFVP